MRKLTCIFVFCCAFVTACGGSHNGMTDGGAIGDAVCPLAPDAAAPAAPDASVALGDQCQTNDQCLSGLCFNFNSRGPHCTTPCTDPCQCPLPTRGCSNMGVCKSP
jgi:hypothetical protein